MRPIRFIKGDATSPQAAGPKIIAHIGCGLAGGKWERIEPLVVATLCVSDIPTVVYDRD